MPGRVGLSAGQALASANFTVHRFGHALAHLGIAYSTYHIHTAYLHLARLVLATRRLKHYLPGT